MSKRMFTTRQQYSWYQHWLCWCACLSLWCLADMALAADADVAAVKVVDGWVRASLPGGMNTAAFLTMENASASEVKVVAVSCAVARACELHQHVVQDDKMRLEKVNELVIPPNSTFKLSTGGYHVMLLDLLAPVQPGSQVELVFSLSDGSTIKATLPVRSVKDE